MYVWKIYYVESGVYIQRPTATTICTHSWIKKKCIVCAILETNKYIFLSSYSAVGR